MTRQPFRVLVVEDNPMNVALFTAVLRREGYDVDTVMDGTHVEQRVADWRPDLVLMDINLPAVDGPELLLRLRANAATAQLPVLAVTAHAMKGDDERFVAMGFDGYISKPIDIQQFRALVRQMLDARPPGCQSDESAPRK